MRPLKWMVVLFFSIGWMLPLSGQSHYAVCIVDHLDQESDCRVLEDSLRVHPGIRHVRCESSFDNLVILFDEGACNEDLLAEWLGSMGYSVRCFNSGLQGGRIPRLQRGQCESGSQPEK